MQILQTAIEVMAEGPCDIAAHRVRKGLPPSVLAGNPGPGQAPIPSVRLLRLGLRSKHRTNFNHLCRDHEPDEPMCRRVVSLHRMRGCLCTRLQQRFRDARNGIARHPGLDCPCCRRICAKAATVAPLKTASESSIMA